jgi:hypothetical protein
MAKARTPTTDGTLARAGINNSRTYANNSRTDSTTGFPTIAETPAISRTLDLVETSGAARTSIKYGSQQQ